MLKAKLDCMWWPLPRPVRIISLGVGVLVGVILCLWLLNRFVADRYNPFAPLVIADRPSLITNFKIASLKASDQYCFSVLDNSDLKFERLPDRATGRECGFFGAATLHQSQVSWGGEIALKCPALVGLAIWERHNLQPISQQIFGQKIVRIRHFGTYSCRNINNGKSGQRSEHAYANAVDISGFRLADGTEISVLRDWGKRTEKGKFLKAAHKSACGRFSTVLGPNYNALHKDHFHFDQGPNVSCK